MPARHSLLVHRQVPWAELLRYPLMAGHPIACEGCYRQMARLLRSLDDEATLVVQATSLDMMLTQMAVSRHHIAHHQPSWLI